MLKVPKKEDFEEIFDPLAYLDESKDETNAGLIIESNKRMTAWNVFRNRNNAGAAFMNYEPEKEKTGLTGHPLDNYRKSFQKHRDDKKKKDRQGFYGSR